MRSAGSQAGRSYGRMLSSICLSSLFVACLFAAPGEMVKQGDFKRCDQSAFCYRQRSYADLADKLPGYNSPYQLIPDSLKVDEAKGEVTANLLDTERNVPFVFTVSLLRRNTARVQIKEARPVKPRYELLGDFALAAEYPSSVPIKNVNRSDAAEGIAVTFGASGQNSLVVHSKPFKFELAMNGVPAVTFNEKGYFYYEHMRSKNSVPKLENQAAAAGDGSVPAATDETKDNEIDRLKKALEKDLWEETFNGKTDSKPNGAD